MSGPVDIQTLAHELASAESICEPRDRILALALFRLLADGAPVAPALLAERAGASIADAVTWLRDDCGTQFDEHGRVVAFGGLTLRPTAHVLEVDGRELHTWCAWDTLFLPELLGRAATVRSISPTSGRAIALDVDASGVQALEPSTTVLSMLRPTAGFARDTIGTFCCFVHFFASEADGQDWIARNDGTFLISVRDGFELGRLTNHEVFGAALAAG